MDERIRKARGALRRAAVWLRDGVREKAPLPLITLLATALLLLLLLFAVAAAASAGEYPKYEVSVADNHDGDTLRLKQPIMWPIYSVRVRGVDTPEIGWRAECPIEAELAEEARIFTRDRLAAAQHVIVSNIEEGKFGRLVATVTLDGEDLADLLIKSGFGRPYGNGKRLTWCEGGD